MPMKLHYSLTAARRFTQPDRLLSLPSAANRACLACQRRWALNNRGHPISTSSSAESPSREASSSLTRQAPDISNHYTIFPRTLPQGLPPAGPFNIPVPDLRREFLALQGVVHPDKYPTGRDKQRAEALSARINDAYRTLSDPLARAQYLLAYQHGIDVTSEDGAKEHPQDPETLMQVLEVQEAIEEAEDETTVLALKTENEGRIDDTVRVLGRAIDEGSIDEAVKECVRLRFWYSIRDVLREWAPGKTDVRLIH
ncbi:hypothetical protein LOZ53_006805 [Ophidiomyces ophidiicola]|nr:hypothetical protein LOZ55_006864 [Ophidiomyces ophidiicola]KAI1978350.1 hypothetical protein LOZ54_006317 [Ophidiomyces ophidiicola]KAI1978951.1 hypothetical protein LOZ53_006805 [Ophidiomyces ophidiicola]KAI1984467.1 hypothetical protein LOZ51_006627 [Ophidiomyces ophidiicola]